MKKQPKEPTKIIDEIQISLAEMKLELQAYKILFQGLGTDCLKGEELKGFSLVFNRLIKTIDETNEKLSVVYGSLPYRGQ